MRTFTRRGGRLRAGALAAVVLVGLAGCSKELTGDSAATPTAPPATSTAEAASPVVTNWPDSALTLAGIAAEPGPDNGYHWWLSLPAVSGLGTLASDGSPAYSLVLVPPPCADQATAEVTVGDEIKTVKAKPKGKTVLAAADGKSKPTPITVSVSTPGCKIEGSADPRTFYAGLELRVE